MREIKFRAWDKKQHKMLDYCIFGVGSYLYNFEEEGVADWGEYLKKYAPMQYTGLKDKKGIEIYEGDIVGTPLLPFVTAIEFRQGAFCLITRGLPLFSIDPEKFEVIGNIYETPELLK